MSTARSKISAFLQNAFFVARPEGPISSLQIVQVYAGGGTSPLREWQIPEGSEVDLEQITQEALDMSDEDAQAFGGAQRYAMIAYFGAGRACEQRSPVWIVSVRRENEDQISESEPATNKGMLAQQMRHNEAIMKLALNTFVQQSSVQQSMLARLAEQLEAAQRDKFESLKLIESMLSEEAERRLAGIRAENREKRLQTGFEHLQLLAPVLINKLAGQKLLPEKLHPATDALKRVMGTLTPEQIGKVMGALSPDQAIALSEVYEAFREEHEREQVAPGSLPAAKELKK